MRFLEVLRLELAVQLGRRSVWLHAAAFPLLAFAVATDSMREARDAGTMVNPPLAIASVLLLATLFGLPVTAALFGDAATRDARTRMEPLLHATPLGRAAYFGGRFLAAFAVNALLLATVPAGVLAAARLSGAEPALVAPFRLSAYAEPYLALALPNVLVAGALTFAAARLARTSLASYATAAVLFVASLSAAQFLGATTGRWALAAHVDPFGIASAGHLAGGWTEAQRSTLHLPLQGWLVTNRLLWLAVATAAMALVHARFRFASSASRGRWWSRRTTAMPRVDDGGRPADDVVGAHGDGREPAALPRVHGASDSRTRLRQVAAVAVESVRQIVWSRGWLLPLGAGALLVLLGPELMEHLGVPLVPVTDRVVTVFAAAGFPVLVTLLTVFYAGELAWRERDAGLDPIADVAPVPDGVLLLGRLAGLGIVVTALQAIAVAAGMLVQVTMGHRDVDPALYAGTAFGLQLAEHLTFAAFALAVHVLVDRKHAGHLVVLLACGFTAAAGGLGLEDGLLVHGAGPGWEHSDVRGFAGSVAPWGWHRLYWAAWALLLVLLARLFRVRGRVSGPAERLRAARMRITRRTATAGVAAMGMVVVLGGFVFYNTHVLNDFRTDAEGDARRAAYERLYGRFADVPQPVLTAMRLRVELHPHERRAEVRGGLWVRNRSGVAIDSIHLATAAGVATDDVAFDRPAEPVLEDARLHHRIYRLATPLRAGDSLRVGFRVRFQPRGFTRRGVDPAVSANGTFVELSDWLPSVGYRAERELDGAGARRRHGLAARPSIPSLDDRAAAMRATGRERIRFDATIGTASDQVAVTTGTLRASWRDGGRRYFRYVADAPVRTRIALASADYAVRRTRAGDVDVEILHHPGHPWSVERMEAAARASLEDLGERFGPLPHRQIRLVERPGDGFAATSYATMIGYDEGFALMDAASDPRGLDFPSAVVAHEVAHQWWGHRLAPAQVEGAPLLTESLAWYSALGVVERSQGADALRRLLDVMRESYLTPRSRAGAPLLRASDWFQSYRKGPFAMASLRGHLGEARVDEALRRLLAAHESGALPAPTSRDLLRELRAVSPDSLQPLLTDLFERNTFWELETRAATAEPAGGGTWRVDLDVAARKTVVDTAGVETEVTMDEPVEVAVFAAGEDGSRGDLLHRGTHRIRSGEQRITVTVAREPAHAAIDPRHLLIDVEPRDDLVAVRSASPSRSHPTPLDESNR